MNATCRMSLQVAASLGLLMSVSLSAQSAAPAAGQVTFAKDIAPIHQRSCQT